MKDAALRTRAPKICKQPQAFDVDVRSGKELVAESSGSRRMNQYQLQLVELDRRQRIKMRALSFVGAGTVIVLALWSAGVPPMAWVDRVQGWINRFGGERAAVTESRDRTSALPPAAIVPDASPDSLSGTDSSVSRIPLALMLVSTSPGRSVFEGTARLGTSSANPQTYAAGALLANGARLAEVHKTYVILQRGENRARLNLVGPSGAVTNNSNDLFLVGRTAPRAPAIEPSHEILTDYIRPSPVFDGEMIRGYEVYAGLNSAVFNQLGLQAGDVILALNDVPFVDSQQAMDMFHQITVGMAVVGTVERQGRRERITLDGSLITADRERRQQAAALTEVDPMTPF